MWRIPVFWLFLMCSPQLIYSQASFFKTYSVDEGVAQSQVYALLQDHQGNIWMGTRGGGISKFDGKNFSQITERDGLSNNFISKIIQDPKHNIWIGTNNGLTRYDGKKYKRYQLNKKLGSWTIYDLAYAKDGSIWIGSNQGLFQLKDEVLIDQNESLGFSRKNVNALHIDTKGKIWLGTGVGLFLLEKNGKQTTIQFLGEKDRNMRNAITCIKSDTKGNLWYGTYGDGMYGIKDGATFRIDLQRELYKSSVFDLYFDADGSCWIATLSQGVVEYNMQTKSFAFFNQKQGISNNHVRCILQDNAGTLWLGTSGGGVCQFRGSQFMHFTSDSGLGGNFVYSIFRDQQDRLWVGTSQNGVSVLSGDTFSQFNATTGFASLKVKSIAEDVLGTIYLGTEGQGVWQYKNAEFSLLEDTKRQYIKQIIKAKDSTLWAATSGAGLVQWNTDGEVIRKLNYENARLLQSRLTCLLIDDFGRIWYGSESYGVGVVDLKTNKKWRFTTESAMPTGAIRTMTKGKDKQIWVGTAGGGIIEFEAGKNPKLKRVIGTKEGLTSANIYLISADDDGNLLIGSERGLDYLTFNKNNSSCKIRHYSKGDGFSGVETCQNSVFKDRDGITWFGTINGLIRYNPAKARLNEIPPLLSFTDVQLFYESLVKTKYKNSIKNWNEINRIDLPYDQNHLSFLFKGINLRNPEAVEYAWKLKGFDDQWSPWSTEQRIVYSNINSGTYVFLLKARNEDGIESEKALQIPIEIATPYWRKWWFSALLIIVGMSSISLLFVWQTLRIREKAKAAQEGAELAKNLVELEQKALRLQMNPHFIFNALNSIQGLIGNENPTEARYYLAKFSRLMRQILDNSRSASITLEEEIATLENYLLIERFCNGNRFDYQIDLQLDTETNFIQIPPMLVQPFVENALKHGFKFSKEEAEKRGSLNVKFVETETGVLCTIRDNGIGRAASALINDASSEPFHKSTGLNVTKQRLDLLNEKSDRAAIQIIDLLDEQGKAMGTEVQIILPFL